MKFVFLEPVINSGELSSFTIFDEEGEFLLHRFARADAAECHLRPSEKLTHFCFDVFKALPRFGDRVEFLWDVKILYELLGQKCNNFIELIRNNLSHEETRRYIELSEQVKAHLVSYRQAKVDITGYQAVQLLPEDLLFDLYYERGRLAARLFFALKEEDKEFYRDFYHSARTLYSLSANHPLSVDVSALDGDGSHFAEAVRRNVKEGKAHLKFKAVGAKTGRLSFAKNSLNVYNLPKSLRHCVVAPPGKDLIEVDFKSFQPRIAIFSTDSEAFKEEFRKVDDIYGIFPGDRAENKIAFLAWMYGKTRIPGSVFEKYAWPVWELRDRLAKECRDDGFLKTRWGRRLYLKDEEKHVIFQNFITATEVDCVLKLTCELSNRGFDVLFPYHDAIVCEVPEGDIDYLARIKDICENFLFSVFQANFPVEIKAGKTFGAMNEVQNL